MRRELKKRLQRHFDFLASELKYYPKFRQITKSIYEEDDDKRRSVERWVENIVNSSIDICKVILNMEEIRLPDNYKEIVLSVSHVKKVKISTETIEAIARWVRLKNIVTHEYLIYDGHPLKNFFQRASLCMGIFWHVSEIIWKWRLKRTRENRCSINYF
ncbi:MAG: DUF86 domain-containing protein [Thermodesulfovibrionales bacterium]|nr:DUF86 domain-containing protein [Nitrospinota bacterium]MCG2709952.1 DUF86 domain-containing protein [Thermodesulfovibrionales bacterium]